MKILDVGIFIAAIMAYLTAWKEGVYHYKLLAEFLGFVCQFHAEQIPSRVLDVFVYDTHPVTAFPEHRSHLQMLYNDSIILPHQIQRKLVLKVVAHIAQLLTSLA